MTYNEWKRLYEACTPEEGYRLCDYDKAERDAITQNALCDEYPDYEDRYYNEITEKSEENL